MFLPQHGVALIFYIFAAILVGGLVLAGLSTLPVKFRKPLITLVTFLGGLYYVLEFFLPVQGKDGNALTPYRTLFAHTSQVLLGMAGGVGVFSLFAVHTRSIVRRRTDWGFSVTLLAALFAIAGFGLLHTYRPGLKADGLYSLCFDGGLKNLQAAMFSIISFYIVSAAYRAFRIRSVEATILLISASCVMLGQVTLGQAITAGLPSTGLAASFRVETISDWILTRVNSPALLAVELGLGVGLLSTAIRLWLSLERGSYFDKEV